MAQPPFLGAKCQLFSFSLDDSFECIIVDRIEVDEDEIYYQLIVESHKRRKIMFINSDDVVRIEIDSDVLNQPVQLKPIK